MTISFDSVRTDLYNWAVANVPSGMPVIYYYPNAPRPTVDYVTLYITSVTQIGRDYTSDPSNDAGIANMSGDREFTLQVQAYGDDPLTVLENLRTSLQKESVLDSLRATGISYVNWFPIQDITSLIDSRFEQRGTMDLLFRMAQTYTDTIGVIDTVQVTETVKDQEGNDVEHITLTIPP
jgi:hypothetical protein